MFYFTYIIKSTDCERNVNTKVEGETNFFWIFRCICIEFPTQRFLLRTGL